MLGAMNIAQQRRFWAALGREEMSKDSHPERRADEAREKQVVAEILLTRPAAEWEVFFQTRHVPAGRVRRMEETLADPHLQHRAVVHRHNAAGGVGKAAVTERRCYATQRFQYQNNPLRLVPHRYPVPR